MQIDGVLARELRRHYLFCALSDEQRERSQPSRCTAKASRTVSSWKSTVMPSFLGILKESFATCQAVMAQMTARIQAHWDEIETLALQNSRYRIVHYLPGLAPATAQGRAAVTLPARKMVIAAHLAVTPETLSRTLRALSDEHLIEVTGDDVTIADIEALRRHMH